jgi:hypothetical protein
MTLEDEFIDLIDQYGDLVDIYYTQFLEVAFYLKLNHFTLLIVTK